MATPSDIVVSQQIKSVLPLLSLMLPGVAQFLQPLLSLLAAKRGRYILIAATASAAIPQIRRYLVRAVLKNVLRSDLAIPRHDEAYNMLAAYMISRNLPRSATSIAVSAGAAHGSIFPGSFPTASPKDFRFYPWNDAFIFIHNGKPFQFRCYGSHGMEQNVVISGFSVQALEKFMEDCRVVYDDHMAQYISCYKPDDRYWDLQGATAPRPLKTVMMPSAAKRQLIDNIKEFLHPGSREWHMNHGIPYRRGYLLEGQPGTGKSSLSLAVASEFNLKIYILNLSVVNDQSLERLFTRLPSRCIILLEDIDAFNSSRKDSSSELDSSAANKLSVSNMPSLSTLLNAIDGIGSSQGRILIMTTNNKEGIDNALLRPGRIDMSIEMKLCDKAMLYDLFMNMFTPSEGESGPNKSDTIDVIANAFADRVPENTVSPAMVTSILVSHRTRGELDLGFALDLSERVVDASKRK